MDKSEIPLSGELYEQATQPVPLDVWRAAITAYQAAVEFKTPVANPMAYTAEVGGSVYRLADTAHNRGMIGIKQLLGDDQEHLFVSVYARMMAVGPALRAAVADERFAKFLPEGSPDKGKTWAVDDALLDALALAPFLRGDLELDLEKVYAIASSVQAVAEA